MSIDLKIQPKEKESLFAAECAKYGLDPGKTSMHGLECAKYGLDPGKTSMHGLECAKYGLDPGKTSMYALIAAGSQLYRNREKLLSKIEISSY